MVLASGGYVMVMNTYSAVNSVLLVGVHDPCAVV